MLIEKGVFPRKLLHRLRWEKKTKEDTLNLSTFDGDSALKSVPAGLIGRFTTRTSVCHLHRKQVISEHARPSTTSELRPSIHMTVMTMYLF